METNLGPGEAGAGGILPAISSLAGRTSRVVRGWAIISTVAALWLWIITGHSATATWLAVTPELILLLLVLEVPSGVLWFFYAGLRGLIGLPEELRRLVSEGRLRSGELTSAFRPAAPQPRWGRAWTVFRSILELRNLVFRSKGLLVAAGMAVRLRVFNPASLALLFLAFVGSLAITVAAAAVTLLAPFL